MKRPDRAALTPPARTYLARSIAIGNPADGYYALDVTDPEPLPAAITFSLKASK